MKNINKNIFTKVKKWCIINIYHFFIRRNYIKNISAKNIQLNMEFEVILDPYPNLGQSLNSKVDLHYAINNSHYGVKIPIGSIVTISKTPYREKGLHLINFIYNNQEYYSWWEEFKRNTKIK